MGVGTFDVGTIAAVGAYQLGILVQYPRHVMDGETKQMVDPHLSPEITGSRESITEILLIFGLLLVVVIETQF
ncbi:hypothetical protein D3C84_898230 [compost metagenome]